MSTADTYPKILLVTEATLSDDGGGISQTLYNLFKAYPPDRLLAYTPIKNLQASPPRNPFQDAYLAYHEQLFRPVQNRLAPYINPFLNKLNVQWNAGRTIPLGKEIQQYDPDLLIICPNELHSLQLGWRIVQKINIPYIIYFMDDWMAGRKFSWIGGKLQQLAQKVLQNASGWLMISEPLKNILSERYQIQPPASMIVHNPVEPPGLPPSFNFNTEEKYKLIYAGSIWPMHYDALLLTARAISVLNEKYHLHTELLIYSKEDFWHWRKKELEQYPVRYGGFVPYAQLQEKLQEGDILLVTSSFLSEYASFSRSSVQTKITDYMQSGVPILSVGPEYSACNHFISNYKIGFTDSSGSVERLSEKLRYWLKEENLMQSYSRRAYEVLTQYFDGKEVREKLYQFLGEINSLSDAS